MEPIQYLQLSSIIVEYHFQLNPQSIRMCQSSVPMLRTHSNTHTPNEREYHHHYYSRNNRNIIQNPVTDKKIKQYFLH